MCGGSNEVEDSENPKEKYGKPKEHQKDFKGPMKNRSCTDIICCLIFLICIAAMVVVSAVGWAYGDPIKLVYPTNSDGEICGVGPQAGKPYLHYFDILDCAKVGASAIALGCPTPAVCVASCPSTYWVYVQLSALVKLGSATTSDYEKLICKSSVTTTNAMAQVSGSGATDAVKATLIDDEDCAAYYIPTTDLVGRCIPSFFLEITNWAASLTSSENSSLSLVNKDGTSINGENINEASKYLAQFFALKEYGELVFKDFVNAWWVMLGGLGVAVIFCFIWIILLRWIAGIMVWLTLVAFLGVWGYATYYSYSRYYYLKNNGAPDEAYGIAPAFAGEFDYYLGLKKTWLAFGCTCATLLLIFVLIFIFLVKRIRIAIELIKESSKYV